MPVCSHVQFPAALSGPGDGRCDSTNAGPARVCAAHDGTVSVDWLFPHEFLLGCQVILLRMLWML